MDRRSFLTGLFGLAGTAAVTSLIGPKGAEAGVVNPGNGILDELDASDSDMIEVARRRRRRSRRRHARRRPWNRRHAGHDDHYYARPWRRVCKVHWRRGLRRRRCWRERIWY